MSLDDKTRLSLCLAAAAVCFLPWHSAPGPLVDAVEEVSGRARSENALERTEGVAAFVFAVAAAAVVFGIGRRILPANRRTLLLPVIGCGLGAACILVYVVGRESVSAPQARVGNTVWPYLALFALLAAAWSAFRSWAIVRRSAPSPHPEVFP
ncbi:MAG: hypothetical protein ACE5JG_05170 [Planctomycetota bacterium]